MQVMKREAEIYVNQIGYLPDENKYAYISLSDYEEVCGKNESCGQQNPDTAKKEFSVVEKESGKILFTGTLKEKPEDRASGEAYYYADFSDFKGLEEDQLFYIEISGAKSFAFRIARNIYDSLYFSTLNFFKLSRCGQGVCHTGKALVYGSQEKKDVQGGWHDAGDYGRYIVAGAKTVMDLLLAYECSKNTFRAFDILDEVRFELEWMLQMQREDGAVYHKISCYHFCAFINPEDEKDEIVLAPVSTAATADFAGTLAFAASYYKASDPAFSEKLLKAALLAQSYLDCHEDELYTNPPEIKTGGYGDRDVSDERYFALASLFAATKKSEYFEKAMEIRRNKEAEVPVEGEPWRGWHESYVWGSVSGYGTEILLKNQDLILQRQNGKELLEELKSYYLKEAEVFLNTSKNSVFETDLSHFSWGSNGAVCDAAHVMLVAYSLTGKKDLYEACKRQISYILGCNPLNFCYISGFGSKNPVQPHHRPSIASGKIMPGMLAGGPCEWLADDYAKKKLQNRSPLKCYIDAVPSYSTNEIAIYWNSAFIYLLAALYF